MKVEGFISNTKSDYLQEIQNLQVRAIEAAIDGDEDSRDAFLEAIDVRVDALISLLPPDID